jgi:Pentapeptide repeats (8 copies)
MNQEESAFNPILILKIILPIAVLIIFAQIINNHFIGRDVQYFWCQVQEIQDPLCQLNSNKLIETNSLELTKYVLSLKKDISIARSNNYSIWLQSIGSLILGVTAYIAWCNFKVSEEKQIADKFSKAIDQLGSEGDEKIYIRLGGIYTLEQIAQNSKEYHWTIMEILSDFIREKRSIRQTLDAINCEPKTSVESFIQVPIDICAAFTALGRRNVSQDPAGKRINLLRVDLAEMKLSDAQSFNLSNIILCHSNISGIHFSGVDFSGANLNGCYLEGTNFGNANVSNALLSANFSGTILGKTNFSNSYLAGAIFNGASVDGAIFSGADLSGKFFYCGANFSNVHYLEKAIFDETTVVDEKTIFPEGFEFKQGRIRKVV